MDMSNGKSTVLSHELPPDITILLKEYEHRFTEVMHHVERFEKQTDYLQFFVTAAAALGGLVLSGKLPIERPNDLKLAWAGCLLFGSFLAFYLFSATMNSLFLIYLNGGRLAAIERVVNSTLGKTILTWDSFAVPHFYALKPVSRYLWVRPIVLSGTWIFLILILFCLALSVLWIKFVDVANYFYLAFIWIAAPFHIYQWAALNSEGIREIREYFLAETSEISDIKQHAKYISPALPVISVLIIAIFSLKTGAFLPRSRYNFPLLAIPSIYVGDLIFLPLLNYRIIAWMQDCKFLKTALLGWRSAVSGVLSLLINIYIHYMWIHDPWTGFMDTSYGHLTVAGWDHFVFSVFETWLMILFVIHWSGRKQSPEIVVAGKRIWPVFFLFSSMALFDLAIKHWFIIKFSASLLLFAEAAVSLVPLVFGVGIYAAVIRRTRGQQKRAAAG